MTVLEHAVSNVDVHDDRDEQLRKTYIAAMSRTRGSGHRGDDRRYRRPVRPDGKRGDLGDG